MCCLSCGSTPTRRQNIVLELLPAGTAALRVVDGLGRTLATVIVWRTNRAEIDLTMVQSGVVVIEPVDRHGNILAHLRAMKL